MQSNSTFQSFTTSSSSTTINGQTTSHAKATYSDPSGTKTQSVRQAPGQTPLVERYETDGAGRRGEVKGRIQDVTEEEGYEERIEGEYAKREGGA
ncbi:hypothetical protein BDW02DRAFT_383662 [Decorospora gaudefroyi]|uniref:Uncharacterized protein n=1 Tax=Decorospora gaudefroyi TaxID=184978 RepID=A0A6A5KAN2_9PLEO|nr:hypothetical protein BDW02DRAFT_383662 [Decorospora gaudefroyi]